MTTPKPIDGLVAEVQRLHARIAAIQTPGEALRVRDQLAIFARIARQAEDAALARADELMGIEPATPHEADVWFHLIENAGRLS